MWSLQIRKCTNIGSEYQDPEASWITLTTSGTDVIEPINKGLSIRMRTHGSHSGKRFTFRICKTGVYTDKLIITSNAGSVEIPVEVHVSENKTGTIVLEVVDEKNITIEIQSLYFSVRITMMKNKP